MSGRQLANTPSRARIIRKTSVWAPAYSLVWSPHVPQRAQRIVLPQLNDRQALGLRIMLVVRPPASSARWRRVSRPRSAITSMGRQP